MSVRDVIIIGAGPSGLSAAIAARQRDLDYLVLEQGVLVNSIFRFPPQMVFFTTPELLEIGGLPFVSPFDKPTRTEALKYYRKVVDVHDLRIVYQEKVLSVEKEGSGRSGGAGKSGASGGSGGSDGDEVFAIESESANGVRRVRHARHVVMAIGYFDHPVTLGVPGEDLPHVHHYYGEPHPHYRQRVVIVGGGNSAAESALEMFRAGAHVTIVHRAPTLKPTIKYWVRPTLAGELEIPADAVYLLTGYRADADLMKRAGVTLNARNAPVHDPVTFETNVSGLFVAGGAIAGVDTGTIFIENGRFHGEKIIDVINSRR